MFMVVCVYVYVYVCVHLSGDLLHIGRREESQGKTMGGGNSSAASDIAFLAGD